MSHHARLHPLSFAAGLAVALAVNAARAEEIKASPANPIFGSRTDKPDGSSAMTIGRQLPTEWDTKIGTDVSLAAPASAVPSENILRGAAPDRSSGSVWGNLTMPGVRPLGFDKTTLEARVDAGKDQGKLGAILSRSVPIRGDLSVTLQNSYSVTQTLASVAPAAPVVPLTANASTGTAVATTSPTWAADESIRLNINRSGTTLSAGAGSSTLDDQWHSKLSVEQTLLGPLKVTTSVEDAGTTASKKSITAGFKRVW